jgi:hypothetical protein
MEDYRKSHPHPQADGFTREGDAIEVWLLLPGGARAVGREERLRDSRFRVWVRRWWFDPSKGLVGPYEVDPDMLYRGRYRDVHRVYKEEIRPRIRRIGRRAYRLEPSPGASG